MNDEDCVKDLTHELAEFLGQPLNEETIKRIVKWANKRGLAAGFTRKGVEYKPPMMADGQEEGEAE